MTDELFNQIQNFEKTYADILIEWLTLIKNERAHFAWSPNSKNDEYGQKLYEISCKHDTALLNFEKNTDKDILNTYLKYHNENRRVYPFSFNYEEPKIEHDLVINPKN